MNSIIVDDEPKAITVLERYAERVPFLTCKASFRDGFSAISFLQQQDVDLIFLDINMPRLSGIDMIRSLNNPPQIIFTTAYSEHALTGYELNATDYLLKPIEFDRFLKAVNKAHKQYLLEKEAPQKPQETATTGFILLKSGNLLHKVKLEEILYMVKDGNYVHVHTLQKKILIRLNMNDIFNLVPASAFVRIHKSFVVALTHIETLEVHQVTIKGEKIPIGSTYRDELLMRLNVNP